MKTVLKNAQILDDRYDCERMDVLVEGETILRLGTDLQGDQMINLSGYTLLPGFIDAHVHVATEPNRFSDEALRAWVKNGVTTVRELGMLNDLSAGSFMDFLRDHGGPGCARVVRAGKYIDVEGGYGCGPNPKVRVGIIVETPEQAADAVTYQHGLGSEGIKIGIMDTEGPPGSAPGPRPRLTPDMIRAICDRAHEHGMWVAAHLKKADTLATLIECGLDDAAHTPIDPIPDDVILQAVEKGVMFITTIGDPDRKPPSFITEKQRPAFLARERANREGTIANLVRIHDAGGVIAIGTDLIRSDDFSRDAAIAVHEMRQLRQAGFSLREVIRCATINAARICHIEAEEGSVEPGKRANLIAVRGDVDDDFERLRDIAFVMNRGTVIKPLDG